MIKKTVLAILLTVFTLTLFTGCYDYADIEGELLVAGIAFDTAEGDGGEKLYLVTAEVVTLSGNTGGKSSHSSLVKNVGKTPLAAIRGVTKSSSKKLFFGHCRTVAIGKEIAEEGVMPILELVFRDRDIRFSMNLIVARGCKAHELLSAETVMGSINSYEIAETVKVTGERIGVAPNTHIYQMINDITGSEKATMAPSFTLAKAPSGNETYFLDGIAVFSDDKLKGFITAENSVFCMLASGDFKSGLITCTIPASKHPFSINIINADVSSEVSFDGKGATITLKNEIIMSFTEIPSDLSTGAEDEARLITEQIGNFISDNVFIVVKDTFERYGADIFGFTRKTEKKYPEYIKDTNAVDFLGTLKIKVETSVKMQDSGLSGADGNG